jgi:signal transduction histidine kinase
MDPLLHLFARRGLGPLLVLMLLTCTAQATVLPPRPEQAAALRCAVQDSLGLLWLGDNQGLLSWDGRHLNRLDSRDGWEGGGVGALAVDEGGGLWVAADSGLFRRGKDFQRLELNSPVGLGKARSLLVKGEAAWLATERGLLLRHERLGERVLLSGMEVTCLALLPQGDLVCGTGDRGLYRFDAEGNPTAMPESYRRLVKSVSSLALVGEGDLLVAGREGAQPHLALLLGRNGALESLVLRGGMTGSSITLHSTPGGVLAGHGSIWHRWNGRDFEAYSLPRPVLDLPWPTVLDWLPHLAWVKREGRLESQSPARGMLAFQGDRMALAWESTSPSGGLRPLQSCRVGDTQWVLLEGDMGRRLLEVGPRGTREPARSWLPPGVEFQPTSLCPEMDGEGLLIGMRDCLLQVKGGNLDTLTTELGAHWLVPFEGRSILVAGPAGLALLEEGELKRLRVSEPVHHAIPDGFHGILAACGQHLLRLNELDELDTLDYPQALGAVENFPGTQVRQLLTDSAGRIWLLGGKGLFLKSRDDAPWTRPLEGLLGSGPRGKDGGESAEILSMAADAAGRLWLSTSQGTGWLVPDRLPPVVTLLQDLKELDQADSRLVLQLAAADPLGASTPLVRVRLDDQPWSAWREAGPMAVEELLPKGVRGGTYRLQIQAMDAWGNVSQTLNLPLVLPEGLGRLPFAKRLFLLLALVATCVTATFFYPGRPGLYFSLVLGVSVGVWVYFYTTEPLLWWALPVILGLSSKLTTDQLRSRQERTQPPEPGLLDVVDLLRDFGHSGSSTRNLDRLLRSARNLYLDGEADLEVLGRFQMARGVFLDLTAPSLELLVQSLRRLNPTERPFQETELDRLGALVGDVTRLLASGGDPPLESAMQGLAFQLDQLEQALAFTQHRVDLCISSSPLKVLDRVLEDRASELAGVELELRCERETRQVLARLPVDKLQFVLDNLVDNALHWTKDQSTRRLAIEVRERPSTLQIRVTDNGCGMAPEQHERIFDAGVSGRESGGTAHGYGLYRSREIMARFGGRIAVEHSAPGQGSTFLLECKKVEPEGRQGEWNAS